VRRSPAPSTPLPAGQSAVSSRTPRTHALASWPRHPCWLLCPLCVSSDTWNVNPITVQRIDPLFCKNERTVLYTGLAERTPLLIVPVATILVSSMRLRAVNVSLNIGCRGPTRLPCHAVHK